jgi:hypothetical protein
MKSRCKTIALSILVFGLLLSGCLPGQFLGPTITPSPTVTNTPTFTPTFTPTSTATFTLTATSTPVPLLEAIAGNWTGIDKGTVGGDPVPGREVEITIIADCSIGNICGTSTTLVNDELLVSDLVLIEIKDGT